MYQIFFNGYPLYDPRDPELLIREPDIHLAVGEAGEVNFTIDADHPYADKLTRLKGVLELKADGRRIYKGRIRKDTRDFYLSREVESEGLLACLNDSIIPPFDFPNDFLEDADYQAAAKNGNVVQFFLAWLLDQHNSQVGPNQKIILGDVTVADPNNYISRSSSEYTTTMEVIRSKLWDLLGGYPLPDYSGDTTVLHYYADLPLTNTQMVEYGENLLDLVSELDNTDTYTAILPFGADGLTIADLPDGEISYGIVKAGLIIYSEEAEEACGGRITRKVTWDDVTLAHNLQTKAVAKLTGEGVMTARTIEVTAADLGASEDDVARFVVGRHVQLLSSPHGFSATFPLVELEPDIFNPGNTKIVMGSTRLTLTGSNISQEAAVDKKIESAKDELKNFVSNETIILGQRIDGLEGMYFYIKYSAYADGHDMTAVPVESTLYMGTCSTNKETAPTDYREYTWCRVRGSDGKDGMDGTPGTDGSSQYFHVKYSDDGKTFTANNGETLGDWMGTRVDNNPTDPTTFNSYTWKKIVGEDGQPGIDGADGKDGTSAYFYVKYSANANGNPMVEIPDENTWYMGVCSSTSATAPTDPAAYDWTRCRGIDGTNGAPGKAGTDGKTSYLHIKYSDDGATFSGNILSGDANRWVSGILSNATLATIETPPDSSGYAEYISFDSAIPVTPGEVLYFSASTDVTVYPQFYDDLGFFSSRGNAFWSTKNTPNVTLTIPNGAYYVRFFLTMAGCSSLEDLQNAFESGELKPHLWKPGVVLGEELGAYIGTLVDFTEADSETFSDYTWKKFTEDVEEELDEIRKTIVDQYTKFTKTAEEITLSALESYVETSDYEKFKSTMETDLKVWAGGISAKVSSTEQSIKDVDGDLQEKFNTITKFLDFDTNDGMTIGQAGSPYKVVIDNDEVGIYANNVPVQQFDAEGRALTPELKISRHLSLLGYEISEDDSGNINCEYSEE